MIGLLHLPEVSRASCKTTAYAEVVAAGPKVELAKVGSTVALPVYDKHFAGDEIILDGEKLIQIRERDIIGVLET